ncbi:Hypothetical predicted protein [Cloeon dipterum]|uniref:Kinesin motor domain-containing protein n=1 Tax=Cloeon dipterum TaxID=197152 RepID=A0A8S1CXY3_9INSE|nr:Hypothetical predicted protein [Cloeon dipterum]
MSSKTGAGNIKVGVRIRPMIAREENEPLRWKTQGNRVSRFDAESQRLCNHLEFDHVFDERINNTEIFNLLVEPLVLNAVKGFNATILAYGQTSSGKTHTMIGSDTDRGIVPLTMQNIFTAIDNLPEERSFLLGVSFLEVYNEKVRDLLNPEKSDLKVFETPDGNISTDCHVEMVNTSAQMIELMDQGNKNKSIGETNMNDRSSRSHTIFRIMIESQEQQTNEGVARVSQINLVDLAGSERASQTGATGQRYKEGCAINRSLLQLGNVVQKLSEDKGEFIDYRSSKLTRILQPSLSGNANIVMICNVTPYSADQTANTLLFASRASTIKLDPHLNEIMDDATLLKRHTKRIQELEKNLQEASLLKERNQNLEREIEKLKDMLIVSSIPSFKHDRQRALRRQTWGGPTLKLMMETAGNDFDLIHSGPATGSTHSIPDAKKVSLPDSITTRNDDFNDSVCMSIDEFDCIPPFITSRGEETPIKYKTEITNLKQQLAEKSAATPVLRGRIVLLEGELAQQQHANIMTVAELESKMQRLEVEKAEIKPGTPIPKLREKIKTLEEKLEIEHTVHVQCKQTLEEMEKELASKTEALQLKSKEYEILFNEKSSLVVPGTPVSVLHDRIKQLQEKSSQLPGTPPALLKKKIKQLEDECKYVETELSELREFTTLEKQIYDDCKVKELREETNQLKLSIHDYEQLCADLRKDHSSLTLHNADLKDQIEELNKLVETLTKELETNRMWNSKANEQQLIWKRDLDQCREQISVMKNQSQDWIDEKEILKTRYESKIKELTASLEEAWAAQDGDSRRKSTTSVRSVSDTGVDLSALQKKISELEASLAEAHSKLASSSVNSSCQTEHDTEEIAVNKEQLQLRLNQAENELASLRSKRLGDSSSQTNHDDDIPCDTQGLMPELEKILDEKNSLAEQLEKLNSEHADLKRNVESIMLEYESMQAEVQDLRVEKENAHQEAKKDEEIKNFIRMRIESSEAVSSLRAESERVSSENVELLKQVASLEKSIVDQELLQEQLFFMTQENEQKQFQLECKQESLNFNLTEMERLKNELSQARLNACQQPDVSINLNKKIADLELEKASAEEAKNGLELHVRSLQCQISALEKKIDFKELSSRNEEDRHNSSMHNYELLRTHNHNSDQGHQPGSVGHLTNRSPQIPQIVEELKEQMKRLESANETLKSELNNVTKEKLELSSYTRRIEELDSFLAFIKNEVKQLTGEAAKSSNLKELHSELLSAFMKKSHKVFLDLNDNIRELETKYCNCQRLLKEQTEIAKASENERRAIQDAFAELRASITTYEEIIEDYKVKEARQTEELENCQKLMIEMQSKLDESHNDSMVTLSSKEMGLTLELNEAKECLEMAVQEERQLRARLADKEQELVLARESHQKLNEKIRVLETNLQGTQAVLEETMHIAETAKEKESELVAELASNREKVTELEHALDVTEKSSYADKARCEQLQEDIKTLKGKLAEAEDLELKMSDDIMDKVMELERMAALSEEITKLKAKISELEGLSSSSTELEVLRQRVEELAQLESKAAEVDRLLQKVKELEALKQEVEEVPRLRVRMAELEAEKAVMLQQLSGKELELEETKSEVERLRGETTQVEELKSKLSVLDEYQRKAEHLKAEVASLSKTGEELHEVRGKLQEMKSTMQALEETAAEATRLRDQVAELEVQLEEANKNLEARMTYAANLEEELEKAKSVTSFLEKSVNTTTDLQLTLEARDMEQILALESANMNMKSELQQVIKERESLIAERSSLEEKVVELENTILELKGKCGSLQSALAQHTAKEAKMLEQISCLRAAAEELSKEKDRLHAELEALRVVQVKANDAEQFSAELDEVKAILQEKDSALQQALENKQAIEALFQSKCEEVRLTEEKYSALLEEHRMCCSELEGARRELEGTCEQKSQLQSNLEMYKANIEQLRGSLDAAEAEKQHNREQLQADAIRLDNERYEIELQLQEKTNQVSDLEAKITNTNTILNRVAGERDVLSIRMQEMRDSLATTSQELDELRDKCKENDSDYEELLSAYREMESKSKNFQVMSIHLREEKAELTARLQKLEEQVSSLSSVDHASCQQSLKQMEAKVQEKHNELVTAKRDLSNANGELIYLKMNMKPEPSVLDHPNFFKTQNVKLEKKVSSLQEQVNDLTIQLTAAKIKKERDPLPVNFCLRCLPKGLPMDCAVQAVANIQEAAVQAPPDNDTLCDRIDGFTPTSAITEAARMYGMRDQIKELEAQVENLQRDRKMFKDVLRRRMATIKALESELSQKEQENKKMQPGQENKPGAPLIYKNN